MPFIFGQTVLRSPPVYAEGADDDDEKSFSLLNLGRISPKEKEAAGALWEAAFANQVVNENAAFKSGTAANYIWQEKLQKIKDISGVALPNPLEQAKADETAVRGDTIGQTYVSKAPAGIDQRDWGSFDTRYNYYLSQWQKQADNLAQTYPEQKENFSAANISDEAIKTRAWQINRQYQKAAQSPYLSGTSRFMNTIAASAYGSSGDPVTLGSMVIGGGVKLGSSVLARIAGAILGEAAVNAGSEALTQAGNYSWKKEAGIEASFGQAMEQVAMAGAIGGVFGGSLRGGHELAGIFRKNPAIAAAAERAARNETTAEDVMNLAEKLDVPLDNMEKRVIDVAGSQDELEKVSFDGHIDDITPEDKMALTGKSIGAVDADEVLTGADYAPPRRKDVNQVIDEAAAPISKILIEDKSVTFHQFDLDELQTDALTYQYKDGGDSSGVTGILRNVQKWDPTGSGKIFVHERADGLYIADGHQRLGLAKRLREKYGNIKLDGYLYREKDGWTAADMRALAARKNLQEGSGTAMDAARIIRDRPDIVDDGLPISGPMMKKAIALSRLSDNTWGMVINGIANEDWGAIVGRMISDPNQQSAVLADLARFAPDTERQAELLVRELQQAGFRHETQTDMFGMVSTTRSLMAERVKVLDEALKTLRNDKKIFATLSHNADMIEAAGNVLDAEGNISRATAAETIGGLIEKLARSKGTISDALTQAAERYANGSNAKKEARAFIKQIQEAMDKNGLAKLLQEEPPQVLKPAQHTEPSTHEAANQAELQLRESKNDPQSQENIWDFDRKEPLSKEKTANQQSIWDIMPDDVSVDNIGQAKKIDLVADTVKNCKK